MADLYSLGIFQGEAPQFIILSASIGFYVYVHHFIWDYFLPKNEKMNKSDNQSLGILDEDDRGNGDLEFFKLNLKHFVGILFFANIFILIRILLCRFFPEIGHTCFCILDVLILGYFLGILIFSLIVFRAFKIKSIETGLPFSNNKY